MSSVFHKTRYSALCLGALLAASGCSSAASHGGSGDVEGAQSRGKNGKVTPSAEIARLRVERDRLVQANQLLEQELADAHADLKRVEQQFAIYEERLASDQGKAAAVAAAAEARIRYDKLEREHPNVLSDSTSHYVQDLIESSERLIRKQNFAAAQFFAERANHTMNSSERRASMESALITRTVSVDVANVREGPGQGYSVVDRLSVGAVLLCWGTADDWYHVRTPNGVEGWIHASLVR